MAAGCRTRGHGRSRSRAAQSGEVYRLAGISVDRTVALPPPARCYTRAVLALRVVAVLAGLGIVAAVLWTAVRTVAVPRAEQVTLVRVIFRLSRRVFWWFAGRARTPHGREAALARYAPVTLLLLPFSWAFGVIVGFALVYLGLGTDSFLEAVEYSGSSFSTLGFRTSEADSYLLLGIVEALIGLGLVALLLSYMPALYAAFSRREALVAQLEVRAGEPVDPEVWITRAHRIGWLDQLDETWAEWERWFIDIEESHTSYPSLTYFRSPVAGRSWLSAAGCVLDTAALIRAMVDVPVGPHGALCIRAGYVSLRRVADFFGISYDPNPRPTDAIAVAAEDFYALYDRLAEQRVPLKPDREQAWRDFAGWRVNYESVLLSFYAMAEVQPPVWPPVPRPAPPRRRLVRRDRQDWPGPAARTGTPERG